jgi:hypothetical protein
VGVDQSQYLKEPSGGRGVALGSTELPKPVMGFSKIRFSFRFNFGLDLGTLDSKRLADLMVNKLESHERPQISNQ